MKVYRNFTEAYYALVEDVYQTPQFECSPRGSKIRENLCVSFVILDPRNRLLYIPERKFSLQYVAAEILWYALGENKTEWIENYSSVWKNISDDGTTANSAYGSRIFTTHKYQLDITPGNQFADGVGRVKMPPQGWTQWEYVKQELLKDSDSRRAVIHIRQPQDSYLAQKDVPCTLSLQFFIRDNKLSLMVNMRSTDLIFGLANDVPAFTFMQEMMANELGLELGPYFHTSNSLHIYERHFEMCKQILAGVVNYSKIPDSMPSIPGQMPTEKLDLLQRKARNSTKSGELLLILDWANETESEPLWRDWARILVMHRLQKLGMLQEKELLRTQIEFAGFKELL